MRKELTVSRRCYSPSPRPAWAAEPSHRLLEPVPFVRLSGRWLRRLGFPIGAKIAVEAEEGRLVLTAIPATDSNSVGV